MPLVRVRILQGTKLLGSPTRPYHGSTTLQSVLEKALAGLSGYTVQSVNVYPSVNEEAARRSDFLPEDFGDATVDELVDVGLFWVAHVAHEDGFQSPAGASGGASAGSSKSSLPNSLDKMMESEDGVLVTWPPDATGGNFEARIYNSLIADLKAQSVGFHYADAGPKASGTMLLKTLAHALQYALPFGIRGALSRRSMHVPDRFKEDVLKAHAHIHYPHSYSPTPPLRTPLPCPDLSYSSLPCRWSLPHATRVHRATRQSMQSCVWIHKSFSTSPPHFPTPLTQREQHVGAAALSGSLSLRMQTSWHSVSTRWVMAIWRKRGGRVAAKSAQKQHAQQLIRIASMWR